MPTPDIQALSNMGPINLSHSWNAVMATQSHRAKLLEAEMASILDPLEELNHRVAKYLDLANDLAALVGSDPDALVTIPVETAAYESQLVAATSLNERLGAIDAWRKLYSTPPTDPTDASLLYNGTGLIEGLDYNVDGTGNKVLTAMGETKLSAATQFDADLLASYPSLNFGPKRNYQRADGTTISVNVYTAATLAAAQAAVTGSLAALNPKVRTTLLAEVGVNMSLATSGATSLTIKSGDIETWVKQVRSTASQINNTMTQNQIVRMQTLKEKWQETFALLSNVLKTWTESMQSILASMK